MTDINIDKLLNTTVNLKERHVRAVRYSYELACMCGVNKHAMKDMEDLGINIIAGAPESISACWMFLIDYEGNLPDYIKEIGINKLYWKDMCKIEFIE